MSFEKKKEIFSEENIKDMKDKTGKDVEFMISDIETNSKLSMEQKNEYIKMLKNECEELDL